jgi:hypothetical protein
MQQFPSAPRPDQPRNGGRHSPPRIPAPRAPGNQSPRNRIPSPRTPQPEPSRIIPTTASAAAGEQTAVQTQPNAGAVGLTINKVIAGAGAAATSAVLGSFFGAEGTVAGAALGSVASTVATAVYQQSLDRTRDRLVARVRVPRRGSENASAADTAVPGPVLAAELAAEVTMPMPRISPEGATTQLRVEPAVPARTSRRRFVLWSAATVLIFALSMLAVTGVEWVKREHEQARRDGRAVHAVGAVEVFRAHHHRAEHR